MLGIECVIKGGKKQMKPKYTKTRERGWCWVCQYGNIITTSTVSAEECYRKHIRKLYGLCFNVEQIERNIDFINRQEREVERQCYSY